MDKKNFDTLVRKGKLEDVKKAYEITPHLLSLWDMSWAKDPETILYLLKQDYKRSDIPSTTFDSYTMKL